MNHYELITKFYSAFQQRDWKTMHSCYHPEVTFYDPAFRDLNSKEARAMWHMLCLNAKDFELNFNSIEVAGDKGSCHWEANYSFSKTGRMVNNKIKAAFTFKDGLIFDHRDEFDLWRWSGMALGTMGTLLGWSPFTQNKINDNALKSLKKFMTEHPM